jgi:TetR/AcrR family transcriptional regulator, hemagglutinin/protease regulatory protein
MKLHVQKKSKTPKRAHALDKTHRRALLLECAIRVFARRGIGAGRHAEVAKEAKVSVPTVFFYFPTRRALVRDVLKEIARFFSENTEQVYASERPAPQVVMEEARHYADLVLSHPDHVRVLQEWSTAIRDKPLWSKFLEFQQHEFDTIENTIRKWRRETGRDEGNPDDDARVLTAIGYIVTQMRLTNVPDERIERFVRTVVRDTLGEVPAEPVFRSVNEPSLSGDRPPLAARKNSKRKAIK